MLLLLPLTEVLAVLPLPVLAGIVIAAVISLIDVTTMRLYWRWSRPQFAVGILTSVATLSLAPNVERGVLVGVAAALAVHLWRELNVSVPASLEDTTLHLHPIGVFYFGSAPGVEQAINSLIAQEPHIDRVVLHLDAVGRLDLTGALMLRDIAAETQASGREFAIEAARPHAAKLLERVLGI